MMDRANAILNNEYFNICLQNNISAERDRIFCKHNLEHFIDVARIAYIKVLEEGLEFSKEIIYATALLHDIGRFRQYEDGTPHEEASAEIAREILKDSGFDAEEILMILKAIRNHRKKPKYDYWDFNRIIYVSDKLSRACYSCGAKEQCDWKDSKKNFKLIY